MEINVSFDYYDAKFLSVYNILLNGYKYREKQGWYILKDISGNIVAEIKAFGIERSLITNLKFTEIHFYQNEKKEIIEFHHKYWRTRYFCQIKNDQYLFTFYKYTTIGIFKNEIQIGLITRKVFNFMDMRWKIQIDQKENIPLILTMIYGMICFNIKDEVSHINIFIHLGPEYKKQNEEWKLLE